VALPANFNQTGNLLLAAQDSKQASTAQKGAARQPD